MSTLSMTVVLVGWIVELALVFAAYLFVRAIATDHAKRILELEAQADRLVSNHIRTTGRVDRLEDRADASAKAASDLHDRVVAAAAGGGQ